MITKRDISKAFASAEIEEVKKELQELGICTEDVSGNMKSFRTVLEEIAKQ